MNKLKLKAIKFARKVNRRLAINNLKANPALWKDIQEYMKKTNSTGCSWSDFWQLYHTVRTKKPKEILELGPGASTLVLAHALMENEKEGHPGRITAMEELQMYLDMSIELLPKKFEKYVDYNLSPRIEDYYTIFRGVRYEKLPERDYDFVFIDGPHHHSPIDDAFVFDFDFIRVVEKTKVPVSGLVDYRLSTSFVLQSLLGTRKVKFDAIKEIAIIAPCTKEDLKGLELKQLTKSLLRDAKFFSNTRVNLI